MLCVSGTVLLGVQYFTCFHNFFSTGTVLPGIFLICTGYLFYRHSSSRYLPHLYWLLVLQAQFFPVSSSSVLVTCLQAQFFPASSSSVLVTCFIGTVLPGIFLICTGYLFYRHSSSRYLPHLYWLLVYRHSSSRHLSHLYGLLVYRHSSSRHLPHLYWLCYV